MVNNDKRIMRRTIAISVVFAVACILCSCGMANLPDGELLEESLSPDGKYQVNSYLVSAGATVANSIKCEVVEVESGTKRNIYWQYRCEDASIEWIDNRTVVINGVTLDILTDSYDWRNE